MKYIKSFNEGFSHQVSISDDVKSNINDKLLNFTDENYKVKMYNENPYKYVIEIWKDTGGFRRFAKGVDIESDKLEDIKSLISYLKTLYDRVEMEVHTTLRSGRHPFLYGDRSKYKTRRNLEPVVKLSDVKTIYINLEMGPEPKPTWS